MSVGDALGGGPLQLVGGAYLEPGQQHECWCPAIPWLERVWCPLGELALCCNAQVDLSRNTQPKYYLKMLMATVLPQGGELKQSPL